MQTDMAVRYVVRAVIRLVGRHRLILVRHEKGKLLYTHTAT